MKNEMSFKVEGHRDRFDKALVDKMIKAGVSKARAESIVKNLSSMEISQALTDAKSLKAIIDIEHRPQ